MNSPDSGLILQGVPASPGLAVGRVCFWSDPESLPRYLISPDQVKAELTRLDEALEASRRQLEALRMRVEKDIGKEEAAIFNSHALLLNDPAFYARVEKKLINDNLNLEAAVEEALEDLIKIFMKIPDPYIRERADDYRDVGRRVLDNLLSHQRQCTLDEGELIIMAARELMPSDTVHFQRQHVGAFITERGGVSSHAAILARSLRLPAVVHVPGLLAQVRAGQRVLVDGDQGKIFVDPSPAQVARAQAVARGGIARMAGTQVRTAEPARTADGVLIYLSANLTRESEAEDARRLGALGVGLLRTEFLFMDRGEYLDEAAQYEAYRQVVETMAPHEVIIRTLDLSEDKQIKFLPLAEGEHGCVLGWRSLRVSLANLRVFKEQLRAILRAGVHGPVRILLPMVTGVEEIRTVRGLIRQAAEELAAAGLAHRPDLPLGVMIETPAAAVVPALLLQEADFLSVGTNDLVQYLMVADRLSERMHDYYRPAAPAMVAVLKRLVDAADTAGKDISICGEIAGDPMYVPLLLGLGYRRLSLAPVLLPDLARQIPRLKLSECETLAGRIGRLAAVDEVEALLKTGLPA